MVLQAVLVVLSQGVSNFANDYMSYPTKLLFKASKLIVIMVVGRCLIGRRYHMLEVRTRGTWTGSTTFILPPAAPALVLAACLCTKGTTTARSADFVFAPAVVLMGSHRSGWLRCYS